MALAKDHREDISLDSATRHILEECRMVLPGIQALFGFQLIAVFNEGFRQKLSLFEQQLHLASLLLIAVAVGFTMAPAAFHRQTEPCSVSQKFLELSSRLLLCGMMALAVGTCFEIYLVSEVILDRPQISLLISSSAFLVLMMLWIGLPYWEKKFDGLR
jgi:hypothetical protein